MPPNENFIGISWDDDDDEVEDDEADNNSKLIHQHLHR
jgi:hypothetical protein